MTITRHVSKGMKYRIYPNEEQKAQLFGMFGCARKVYNLMLEDAIHQYKETGKVDSICQPTKFKNMQEYAYLKEADSLALANERVNLHHAYSRFFANLNRGMNVKEADEPNFKKKYTTSQTYTTNNQTSKATGTNTIRFERFNSESGKWIVDNEKGTHIKLPKISGRVKLVMHRALPVDCTYSSITITHTSSDKWYISVCVTYDKEFPELELDAEHSVGLDYSSTYFFVNNHANHGDYPKFYRESETKIVKLSKSLSRKEKHSNNYEKCRIKLAREYEKIANKRNDWQWKKAHEIADNPDIDYVFVETLNMKSIGSRSSQYRLGKSTDDNGWYAFTLKLNSVLEDNGKKMHRINKWFASSKTCSNCGNINHELKLQDREYICPVCGLRIDRDLNAAINIRNEGISNVVLTNIITNQPQELRG